MWLSCAVAAVAVATAVRAWRERALQRSSLRSTYSGERGGRGVGWTHVAGPAVHET